MEYNSSVSISPEPHDGYLADSEENTDLTTLQAQIQQARNNAKKYQKRKEEGQDIKRKQSKEKKAKDQQSQGQFYISINEDLACSLFLRANSY